MAFYIDSSDARRRRISHKEMETPAQEGTRKEPAKRVLRLRLVGRADWWLITSDHVELVRPTVVQISLRGMGKKRTKKILKIVIAGRIISKVHNQRQTTLRKAQNYYMINKTKCTPKIIPPSS